MDYLYSREYAGRAHTWSGARWVRWIRWSQLTIPKWLGEVRQLFPKETVEVIEKARAGSVWIDGIGDRQRDAEQIGAEPRLAEIAADVSRTSQKETCSSKLGALSGNVVEELEAALCNRDVRRALSGKTNRFRRSPMKIAQNFDWRATVRKNLKNFDVKTQRLMVNELVFFSRIQRRLPWQVILCIDQSGSMASSVIHSAVMAGILAGLPMLKVNLVVFDTSVVDLSGYVDDPVETLMSVQLGGGTDIGKAMTYCESLIENPRRAVFVLVSDFCEGAQPRRMLQSCRRLREAGVKVLGLAALDQDANPSYDNKMSERLAAAGMDIAALTPKQLAEWLAKTIS